MLFYVIESYAQFNLKRDYTAKDIAIVPDSQIIVRARVSYECNIKIVWFRLEKENKDTTFARFQIMCELKALRILRSLL